MDQNLNERPTNHNKATCTNVIKSMSRNPHKKIKHGQI